jgi:hypothetical protein
VQRTLADRVRAMGRFEPVDAVAWTIRVVKGIEQLHKKGLVHGAICPEAIVDRAGRGELLAGREAVECHGPERLADGEPSTMQDVWAVGTVLYFLLTGTMPFPGRTRAEVLARIDAGPPAALSSLGVSDRRLQTLLDRLFTRRLSARIVSAATLREALERWRPELRLRWLPPIEVPDPPEPDADDDDDADTGEFDLVTRQLAMPTRVELERLVAARKQAAPASERPPSRPLETAAAETLASPPPPTFSHRPMVITAAVILGIEAVALLVWQLAK